jgi:hypothetical protein
MGEHAGVLMTGKSLARGIAAWAAVLIVAGLTGNWLFSQGITGGGSGGATLATNTFTGAQLVSIPGIGAVSTDGLVCTNTTAATAVTQQWSCRIRLTGAGWKTNATAASQTADWFIENQTVLGAASPSTLLAMTPQIAGTPTGTAVYITAPNTGVYHDGAILLGGTTASFSGFRSQGNTIGAILADGSAFANFQAGAISAGTTLIATTSATAATYLTATNCLSVASPAVCAAASAGASNVLAAATTEVVNTTAVTANSNIQITEDSSLGTRLGVTCNTQSSLVVGTPRVTARTAGTSFTVTVDVAPTTNPLCFNYTITN